MPPRKSAGPPPAAVYDPDRFYAVTLKRPTTWKGRPLTRREDLELRGDVCEALREDIAEAVLVDVPTSADA